MACASGFSAFFVFATLLLCTIDRFLDTSFLFSQISVAKVVFLFYSGPHKHPIYGNQRKLMN